MSRRLPLAPAALALALVLMTGCATTTGNGAARSPHDPAEGFNRVMFGFNEAMDSMLVMPAASVYRAAVPSVLRSGIGNFFGNLADIWSAVNHLLQGKVKGAAETALRVGVNSTFGFAGLLDVASEAQLPRQSEDFGQTLGRWGVGAGPYVVLPVFGPSSLRDTAARPVDMWADPSRWLLREPRDSNASAIWQRLQFRAELLDTTRAIDNAAVDKYILVRDGYLARRRNQVYDGDPPEEGPAGR